jgi:hypothetical protein
VSPLRSKVRGKVGTFYCVVSLSTMYLSRIEPRSLSSWREGEAGCHVPGNVWLQDLPRILSEKADGTTWIRFLSSSGGESVG